MFEFLTTFLSAYLGQSLTYFAVVGFIFLVVWRCGRRFLAARRIVVRGRVLDARQIGHEIRHTLGVLALGTLQAVGVGALEAAGWTPQADGLGPWGVAGAALTFVGLIAFNDLWFYGMHRLLHTPWLFRHVHAVHHRSVDVNPFTSYSFHLIEALLITGWVIPVALVVPLPLPVLIAVQIVGLANNIMAHLGYELLPAWWVRAPLLRWTNTATFHSQHHTRFRGNYGLFSRVWDRWFGTELDGYEAAFAEAHRADAAGDGDVGESSVRPTEPAAARG